MVNKDHYVVKYCRLSHYLPVQYEPIYTRICDSKLGSLGDKMKLWKKGVIVGLVVWLCVVALLWTIGHNGAYIVGFLAPDFAVLGAVFGYMYDRFYFKN